MIFIILPIIILVIGIISFTIINSSKSQSVSTPSTPAVTSTPAITSIPTSTSTPAITSTPAVTSTISALTTTISIQGNILTAIPQSALFQNTQQKTIKKIVSFKYYPTPKYLIYLNDDDTLGVYGAFADLSRIVLPKNITFNNIECGANFFMGITKDDKLYINCPLSLNSTYKPLTEITNVSKISAGLSHWLALDNNGTIYSGGTNINGQINIPDILMSSPPMFTINRRLTATPYSNKYYIKPSIDTENLTSTSKITINITVSNISTSQTQFYIGNNLSLNSNKEYKPDILFFVSLNGYGIVRYFNNGATNTVYSKSVNLSNIKTKFVIEFYNFGAPSVTSTSSSSANNNLCDIKITRYNIYNNQIDKLTDTMLYDNLILNEVISNGNADIPLSFFIDLVKSIDGTQINSLNSLITKNTPNTPKKKIKAISTGEDISAAVDEDNNIYIWGSRVGFDASNVYTLIQPPNRTVSSIYLNRYNLIALDNFNKIILNNNNIYGSSTYIFTQLTNTIKNGSITYLTMNEKYVACIIDKKLYAWGNYVPNITNISNSNIIDVAISNNTVFTLSTA